MTDREKVRYEAAIAALPKCIGTVENALLNGSKIDGNSVAQAVAACAVMYADALVAELYDESDYEITQQ